MIQLALVVLASTLAVGVLGAVVLRRLPTVRSQLAAFGLLAVVLPLGAVLASGWVMSHMGTDLKILAVAAAAAAAVLSPSRSLWRRRSRGASRTSALPR